MHIPNKTHNLISQFSRFPSFVHIAYKGGKKEGKDVMWSSYAQRTEGMRVEKLSGLHVKMSYLRFGFEGGGIVFRSSFILRKY